MSKELPQPEPFGFLEPTSRSPSFHFLRRDNEEGMPVFSADQMREYGRARERAAYERAMEACTITCAKNHADAATFRSVTKAYVAGCDDCHDAIRALGADK